MSRHGVYVFVFASGFASARALSMKTCPTGLSVRRFRVTIPFGTGTIGSSTGTALMSERLVGNLKIEAATTVRKRPVVRRLVRT
jgi:hypothetical protein